MVQFLDLYSDHAEDRSSPAERAIVRAGIQLFGRRGFGGTSVRQIATEAGVTPPLIGYHFESKEGLFRACVEIVIRGLASMLLAAMERPQTLPDFVRSLAATHMEFPQHHPDAVRLLLLVAYGPDEAQPEVDFVTPWSPVLEATESRIKLAIENEEFQPREGTTPQVLTRQLFSLLHMAVLAENRRSRNIAACSNSSRFFACSGSPVDDLCNQFFEGAGQLTHPINQKPEETR